MRTEKIKKIIISFYFLFEFVLTLFMNHANMTNKFKTLKFTENSY